MNRRAIIVGALGLMGIETVKKIQANGTSVVAIDKRSPQEHLLKLPSITWVNGSADDIELIADILHTGDDIFHFAESSFPGHPEEYAVGVRAFERLNKLCSLSVRNGCRLIYPSSGGTVYGRTLQTPITEEHPLAPISLYGFFKKISEEILSYYNRTSGLRIAILRVANCYGPPFDPQKTQGIINVAVKSLRLNKKISLVAGGKQVRDFVHARDIAELCLAIHRSDAEHTIVNAGSGRGVSMLDAVRLIASKLDVSPNIELLPARPFDVMSNILDSTEAFRLFGWTAKISLEEGVEEICRTL